jgi:hypothetical protein
MVLLKYLKMEIEMNENIEILLVIAFIALAGWGLTRLMSVKETVKAEPEQPKEPEVALAPEPVVEVVEEPVKPKRGRKKAIPASPAPVKPKRVTKKVTK